MRQRIGQAGIRGARVTGKYPAFSKAVPVECVVIAVYYVDDSTNISKAYVEYDVKDLRTGQIYPNVRRLDSNAGITDGEDNVLRPAQMLVGSQKTSFDPKIDQLSQSDGDRVMVAFSYGAHHTPVITDVLPHSKMNYGTTRAQGRRRFQTHQGTSVTTMADGTYQIQRNTTTVTLNPDETIQIAHKSGSTISFMDNGDVQITPASGQSLFIGANGATENLVLGQQLANWLNQLITALLSATYPTAFGPSGPMLPPAAVMLATLQSTINTLLSQMSFTTAEV